MTSYALVAAFENILLTLHIGGLGPAGQLGFGIIPIRPLKLLGKVLAPL